ncbi:MAG: hypothetical protein M1813_001155 [Trichoglossum hirsutum]|nr:MAG: hypothetical protein M1813_001155 [Trichoglossum hirsutum]
MRYSGIHLLVWLSVSLCAAAVDVGSLPTVDLGYEIHQASSFNSTGGYYNFSNIRYGQAPVGDLRFSAPLPPLTDRSVVQKGDIGRACPQALPVWYLRALAELTGSGNPNASDSDLIPPADPREGEDCLFLDVLVPEKIFAKAGNTGGLGAPVMVWIYGGGFTFGEKANSGNPAGLILRSQEGDKTGLGVIYVAINYRGGAFGFLSGPNLQKNGTANAGLLDQRLALEWVQNHIHLFGGDKDRVTVFGQSAGGGSVMHQITAYGGKGKAPFQQAILQSPGFQPYPGNWQQDQLLQQYLQGLNVSTIQAARQLPYDALRAANIALVAKSPYGSFTFAPAVDGDFVPGLPGTLLLHGSFDRSVNVMVGYNAEETLFFVDPANNNNSAFVAGIKKAFPDAQPSIIDYISQTLYPEVYDGTQPYRDARGRNLLSSAEASFTCNTFFLNRAFGNQTYAYRFSIPPAYHGEDVPYTYFNGPDPRVANDTIALAMQSYITTFAVSGQPNQEKFPAIPWYGNNNQILDLNVTGMTAISDPVANERCVWWQKALYF